jgi:hypothetical protein
LPLNEISTISHHSHLGWRIKGWGVKLNFESGSTDDRFSSNFRTEDFTLILFLSQNISNLHKSAENKKLTKTGRYVKLLIVM